MFNLKLFTRADFLVAVGAMYRHGGLSSPSLRGTMSGIKRRARASAIIEFCHNMDPPPPDISITWMGYIQRDLFGRAVQYSDLNRYFATTGRKANDLVDEKLIGAWLKQNRGKFKDEASALLNDIEREWCVFKRMAAAQAGQYRRQENAVHRRLITHLVTIRRAAKPERVRQSPLLETLSLISRYRVRS